MTTKSQLQHFNAARVSRALASSLLLLAVLGMPLILQAGSRIPDEEKYQGEVACYNGNFSQSAAAYRQYLNHHPQDLDAAQDLAAVLMEDGRFTEATGVLEAIGMHGFELGQAYLAAGDMKKAAAELGNVLRQPGSLWRIRLLLGLIASVQGHHAEAVEYYWQAMNEDPKQSTVHLLLARALTALGQGSPNAQDYFRRRAREEYSRALKIDPSLWQVHGDLALLSESEGRWTQSLREWDQVRDVLGKTPEVEMAQNRLLRLAKLPEVSPQATPQATAPATPAETPEGALSSPTPQPTATESPVPQPPLPEFTGVRDIRIQPLGRPADPIIRVGLGDHVGSVAFGCAGSWMARDQHGTPFWEGRGGHAYRVIRSASGRWTLCNWEGKVFKRIPASKTLTLAPGNPHQVMAIFNLYQGSGYFWGGGVRATRYYRGRIQMLSQGGQLNLLNLLPLEDYLASVVPAEMPADWPMEALKAQTVAARTDTLSRRWSHGKLGYDVCNTPHCAEYGGVLVESPRTLAAILATRGQVLARGTQLAATFYSHACGGVTQDFEDAWGKGKDIFSESTGVYDLPGNSPACQALPFPPRAIRPWLTSQPEVFCSDLRFSGKSSFRWVKLLSQAEVKSLLGARYNLGAIKEMKITERSRSAYARALTIVGEQNSAVIRGDRIRTVLGGLRSNLFVLSPVPDPETHKPLAWVVWGGGWGHGVGFCQAGAGAMGERGYSYSEILLHYFPGGELAEYNPAAAVGKRVQSLKDKPES